MRVSVVVVGKVRGTLEEAVREYEERARRYWKLTVTEVPAGTSSGDASPQRVREAEGERILARIPDDLEVVALTRAGESMGSRELAAYLAELGTRSAPGACFVVGGAYGLDDRVLRRAKKKLGISAFTLPHEMARAVLAEQLYRAGTIVRGEPYHKG
jgi:23S rRNA (pseudouridine1915-N3)-methyltransferase